MLKSSVRIGDSHLIFDKDIPGWVPGYIVDITTSAILASYKCSTSSSVVTISIKAVGDVEVDSIREFDEDGDIVNTPLLTALMVSVAMPIILALFAFVMTWLINYINSTTVMYWFTRSLSAVSLVCFFAIAVMFIEVIYVNIKASCSKDSKALASKEK